MNVSAAESKQGESPPMRSDHWRIEAHYVPEDLDDLAELRRRIIEAGHSASIANGLIGWLLSKMAGEPDTAGSPTRSRYRKILADLGPVPDDGDREPIGPLEPAAAGPSSKRRRLTVVRRLSAVAVALGALAGGARHAEPAEAATRPHSAAPGPEVRADEPPRIHGSRRSVKQRLARAA